MDDKAEEKFRGEANVGGQVIKKVLPWYRDPSWSTPRDVFSHENHLIALPCCRTPKVFANSFFNPVPGSCYWLMMAFFFFFVFFGCTRGLWKFLGSGWNPGHGSKPPPPPEQHRIQATSVANTIAHGNAGSLTHGASLGLKPSFSWILVGFVSAEPQWNFNDGYFVSYP